uniref:NLE domain-containing protein n=1 Tax=Chromera velia CCMP2878 TaxID=1169474 RepID=A0A0G4H1G2_9ALVE|eukprot:Cvel_822.t1-p1 / transcript=Cvel_822.t1 / gene=Cvel_822 / organism=Chromera_velia_CCMP2878 / gene_product=Ribosome biogenesis protein WDR12 homolog, putative / transcript_product=Ribosome biogenesis protein WDR12 homolog, putative / location=Cvel_scaffold25:141998-148169(+) / protein_length=523 / sequence_SO=supercontig / SO=protein_coding / is_pseudo=false
MEVAQEVSVSFETDLPEELRVPSDTILVPGNLSRRGLSEIVNQLLELDPPRPFDFLVDEEFLRVTLARFLQKSNRTAETVLRVKYVLALGKPVSQDLDVQDDWISDLSLPSANQGHGVIVSSCYDGFIRFLNPVLQSEEETEGPAGPCEVVGQFQPSSRDLCAVQALDVWTLDDAAEVFEVVAAMSSGEVVVSAVSAPSASSDTKEEERQKAPPEMVIRRAFHGRAHGDSAEAVGVSPDLSILASGAADGSLLLWSNPLQDGVGSLPPLSDTGGTEAAESSRGKKRGASELGATQSLPSHASPLAPRASIQHDCHSLGVSSLLWAKGGCQLASASLDQTVRVWDAITASLVVALPCSRPALYLAAPLSHDVLCTSHDDGSIRIWDLRRGGMGADAGETGEVKGFPRKSLGSSGPIAGLQPSSRSILQSQLPAHRRAAPQVHFNPQKDEQLASVSHDGTLKIFDIRAKGLPLQSVAVGGEEEEGASAGREAPKVLCCRWTEDGSGIVTGDSEGKVRIHRLDSGG